MIRRLSPSPSPTSAHSSPKRWEAYYLVDGKHRDLIADMRAAADWCEAQLSTIEPHVPIINLPGDAVID